MQLNCLFRYNVRNIITILYVIFPDRREELIEVKKNLFSGPCTFDIYYLCLLLVNKCIIV